MKVDGGRNGTVKYGQAHVTEPKDEEHGECVAGQFRDTSFAGV